MDNDHRLRTNKTPISRLLNANCTMVTMDSHEYNMYIASYILTLDLQYKWMLTATPLVNGFQDFCWILHFLESSSFLTLQLPPDTYDNTLNFDVHWVAEGSIVLGFHPGDRFMQVADPYKKCPEFGVLVLCTTSVSDDSILHCCF